MHGATYLDKECERLGHQYNEGKEPPTWEIERIGKIQSVMDAFQVIIDFGNNMSTKPENTAEILCDVLCVSHRTLQQGAISALIQTLIEYADFRTDGRNQYSVDTCKLLREKLMQDQRIFNGKYSAPLI